MNRRKTSTVSRENEILTIIKEYDYFVDSNFLLEPDYQKIIDFTLRLGSVGKSNDDVNIFQVSV